MVPILGEREELDAVIHSSAQAKETGVFLVIVGKAPCWKQTAWGQLAYRLPWVFLPWTFHPSSDLSASKAFPPPASPPPCGGRGLGLWRQGEEVRGTREAGMEGQNGGGFRHPVVSSNPHPTPPKSACFSLPFPGYLDVVSN